MGSLPTPQGLGGQGWKEGLGEGSWGGQEWARKRIWVKSVSLVGEEGWDPEDLISSPRLPPPLTSNLCFFSIQGSRGERGQPGPTGPLGPKVWGGRSGSAGRPSAQAPQSLPVPPSPSQLSLFCGLNLIHFVLGRCGPGRGPWNPWRKGE